jgi:hypothetical protein
MGYHTQILEFIDLEHTPKNLLIRAIKRSHCSNEKEVLESYFAFKQHLSINPYLEKVLEKIYDKIVFVDRPRHKP